MTAMMSIDTNILFHAVNRSSPKHEAAHAWISSISRLEDVALSEFVLAELYGLLRNPAVTPRPSNAREAVKVIEGYRSHPDWRILSFPERQRDLHDEVWRMARTDGFAFRRLFDIRTGISLRVQGVKEFATCNVKDFREVGFRKVWDPLKDSQT